MARVKKKVLEAPAPETPEAQEVPTEVSVFDITLAGHGVCKVWINGAAQELPRGVAISVDASTYHILKEAGELA